MSLSVGHYARRFVRGLRAVLAAAVALGGGVACRPPDEGVRTGEGGRGAGIAPQRTVIGQSVEGRPIECLTFGDGPDCVLILATIHGNESAGTPLLGRLADDIYYRPELFAGRRIILVAVTNPDGYANGTRHNVRGVDLNRNFPASNWHNSSQHGDSALSEPESVAIHSLLQSARPSRIVSLHEPYGCIDYDGPGEGLARAMAAVCDLPVKKLGGRPGSLGSYAGESLGIPIITVEFPEYVARWDGAAMWDRYGKMLLAAIEYSQPSAQ